MNLLQGAYKELMEEEDNESIILGGRHLELDENGENVFGQNQDEINNFDYSNVQYQGSDLSDKLKFKTMLKDLRQQFDLNNFNDWIKASSKVNFVFDLLKNLKENGHKVLIFSKTKILLNMIECIMEEKEYQFSRLDGDVKIPLRDGICNQFNNDPDMFCFLLTSQVSGVGLNLVSADRAIVLDPDWNPANDNQCIDRCYRIGQKRDVIIYRLISTNSVEDKIYRRQVSKQALAKTVTED